jgi:hypothetical protein
LRLVRLEEAVDGDPELVSRLRGVGVGGGHVEDGLGDGAENPTPNTTIGLLPGGIDGGRRNRAVAWWSTPNLPHMARKWDDQ